MLLSLSVSEMMTSTTTCLSWCLTVCLALQTLCQMKQVGDMDVSCREWNQKRMQEM